MPRTSRSSTFAIKSPGEARSLIGQAVGAVPAGQRQDCRGRRSGDPYPSGSSSSLRRSSSVESTGMNGGLHASHTPIDLDVHLVKMPCGMRLGGTFAGAAVVATTREGQASAADGTMRDPIPYALETDWPVGAAGFEPLHIGIGISPDSQPGGQDSNLRISNRAALLPDRRLHPVGGELKFSRSDFEMQRFESRRPRQPVRLQRVTYEGRILPPQPASQSLTHTESGRAPAPAIVDPYVAGQRKRNPNPSPPRQHRTPMMTRC